MDSPQHGILRYPFHGALNEASPRSVKERNMVKVQPMVPAIISDLRPFPDDVISRWVAEHRRHQFTQALGEYKESRTPAGSTEFSTPRAS
ncbi:hypothetical protein NMY22_g11412 [Coprinellus aureogranulatus]|nr:hypothetical protein NMY22_g11412 [Coprinellus aureogranulatus]